MEKNTVPNPDFSALIVGSRIRHKCSAPALEKSFAPLALATLDAPTHRRMINTEEKAQFVAAAWGDRIDSILCHLHPFIQITLMQNS